MAKRLGGVAFVGAMNEDLVSHVAPSDEVRAIFEQFDTPFPQYTESHVGDELSSAVVNSLGSGQVERQLGGSAFNAMRAVLPFTPHLRVGFVGVSGEVNGVHSHAELCREFGVEDTWVLKSDLPPARSISFAHDGDRTLLTSLGANAEAARFFAANSVAISEYLSGFDAIHVTSFLDDDTPATLAQLLRSLSVHGGSPLISLDPSAVWCSSPSDGITSIISSAMLLHLNEDEFADLGGRMRNEEASRVAARISNMMADGQSTLLVRRHDSIQLFVATPTGEIHQSTILNRHFLPPELVVDATGAGDTVAGTVLAALVSPLLQTALAARLGMTMAATKVSHSGPLTSQDVRDVTKEQIGDLGPSVLLRQEAR